MWNLFGKILKNKIHTKKISKLKFQGKTLINPNDISEAINTFFTKIGENLASKFENQNKYFAFPTSEKLGKVGGDFSSALGGKFGSGLQTLS